MFKKTKEVEQINNIFDKSLNLTYSKDKGLLNKSLRLSNKRDDKQTKKKPHENVLKKTKK